MKLSKDELKPFIQDASQRTGVPENLIYSVIMTESGGDPYAIRYEHHFNYLLSTDLFAKSNQITESTEAILQKCSLGLMQVMGAVARELGFKQSLLMLTSPNIGVNLGAKKLKTLIQKYNSTDDVLAAYNAGSPRRLEGGLYVNQAYVNKVREFMKKKEF
jgi:soluble lytic murein transglycosylase-like protein